MSLQYLTNDNPPPPQSALEYSVEPGTVFLSSNSQSLYADLTITVSNPAATPVNCMEFQFGFLAGAANGNLTTVTEAGNVSPVSDDNQWKLNASGFSHSNPQLYLFTATPSGIENYLPLAPNASLTFHLNNILIAQSVGEGASPFTIIEKTIGSNRTKQTVQGTVTLTKTMGQLVINSFEVTPDTAILPGTPIELSWNVD